MSYAVMIGSNVFIGSTGILTVQSGEKVQEVFRIREIFRALSEGSYLAVDVDIKDIDNEREIKLAKSNPVAGYAPVEIHNKLETRVVRSDGSLVIYVEQLEPSNDLVPQFEKIQARLAELGKTQLEAVVRITGEFYAGKYLFKVNNEVALIGPLKLSNNVHFGAGGIFLSDAGFTFN